MRNAILLILSICCAIAATAQDKKTPPASFFRVVDLPDVRKCFLITQESVSLFTQNLGSHAQEHDVNSIILDIEKYIDTMPKTKTHADQLLMKYFAPLRHFFLTTTNKTTLATSFLYPGNPYSFCFYHDTAVALYIGAVKDGDIYNLAKITEKRATKLALENCLLPSLKALDEFKGDDLKYIALSIFYGCKDTREGAPATPATPYCLTLVARLADIQQYAAGLITTKGLLANAELYLGDADNPSELRRITINVD